MEKKRHLTLLDFVLSAVILLLAVFVFYRIKIGLNYKWSWGVICQYLFRIDDATGRAVPGLIVKGFLITIKLAVWSTITAIIIGVFMGIIRSGGGLASRLAGLFYIQLIRNIPPLVLVFIFYYFFGSFIIELTGIDQIVYNSPENVKKIVSFLFAEPSRFPVFISAVITMGVYEGAYITEIVRAGIISVGKGQWEAGKALGMKRTAILEFIVLPQAIRYILPPLSGQFISAIKDSAIVSVISVQELTFQGLEIMASTYLTFEIWIVITFLYFILTFSCSLVFEKIFIYTRRGRSF
ncbi:MAG: amino acid ABC transporter permease [Spirochaetia bacterium]|nr:amino acid ABC transporter permease [Spirochaetia bacterium]